MAWLHKEDRQRSNKWRVVPYGVRSTSGFDRSGDPRRALRHVADPSAGSHGTQVQNWIRESSQTTDKGLPCLPPCRSWHHTNHLGNQ